MIYVVYTYYAAYSKRDIFIKFCFVCVCVCVCVYVCTLYSLYMYVLKKNQYLFFSVNILIYTPYEAVYHNVG